MQNQWQTNKQDQIERYEKNKAKLDEDYIFLPELFQKRMDRLRLASPDDRYSWESYEMFILTQAVLIYDTLQNPEDIEEFREGSWDYQKRMVPDLDDGHSGNTFGCATFMALCLSKGEEV